VPAGARGGRLSADLHDAGPPGGADPRAAAALVGALAFVASYALQRLADAATEPPVGMVLSQATIPYFWRLGFAALHAAGAAVAAGLLGPGVAHRLLRAAPWLVPAVVAPAALAMALVP
jgi:hypothetical protein